MKKQDYTALFFVLMATLLTPHADKGDYFLNAALAYANYPDYTRPNDFSQRENSFGGLMGLEFGFNERTDFHFSLAYTTTPETDRHQSQVGLASYYTPYFGDIHPRFGGTIGATYLSSDVTDASEVLPYVSLNIQGIARFHSNLSLFWEWEPQLAFDDSNMAFLNNIKLGVRFRLGK